jgi:hypothetical protein
MERAKITYGEVEQMFIDMINTEHNPVYILGYKMEASAILERYDPTAYELEMQDYYDTILKEDYYCEELE